MCELDNTPHLYSLSDIMTTNFVNAVHGLLTLQARLLRGTSFVHETHGQYRTLEELWDGEL